MSDWGDLEYDTTIHQWETIEIERRVFILTILNLTFNLSIEASDLMILFLHWMRIFRAIIKIAFDNQLSWLFPWCHDQIIRAETGVTSRGNEADTWDMRQWMSCVTSVTCLQSPGCHHVNTRPIMRPGAGNTQCSWAGHDLSLALLWVKKRGMWRYGQEYSRLSPLKCSCGFLMTPADNDIPDQWLNDQLAGIHHYLDGFCLRPEWMRERAPVRPRPAPCLIPGLVIASCPHHWPALQHPEFNCLGVEVFQCSNHRMMAMIVMTTWAWLAMIHLN